MPKKQKARCALSPSTTLGESCSTRREVGHMPASMLALCPVPEPLNLAIRFLNGSLQGHTCSKASQQRLAVSSDGPPDINARHTSIANARLG